MSASERICPIIQISHDIINIILSTSVSAYNQVYLFSINWRNDKIFLHSSPPTLSLYAFCQHVVTPACRLGRPASPRCSQSLPTSSSLSPRRPRKGAPGELEHARHAPRGAACATRDVPEHDTCVVSSGIDSTSLRCWSRLQPQTYSFLR